MQTYRLDPNVFAVQRRRRLMQSMFLFTLATIAILAFLNRGGFSFSFSGLVSLVCPAIAALLVGGLLTWASLRNLRSQWFSYELTFADGWIKQHADHMQDIEIHRSQIVVIEEYPNTGLKLRTSDRQIFVFIPSGLTEYATVRNHLASWHPIVQKQSSTQLFLRSLAIVGLTVILFATLSLANSVLSVALVAALVIGGSVWGIVEVQRSRTVPSWF